MSELVDHQDGAKLIAELLNGKDNKIACNVLVLLRYIVNVIDAIDKRVNALEAVINV